MPYGTTWTRKPWNVKNVLRFPVFSAKENTNVESKRQNDSGIQGESQKYEKFTDFLFNIWKHHSNKVIMAHMNISSLWNKFDMLTNSVSQYIDILMISETKLDDTFRTLYII